MNPRWSRLRRTVIVLVVLLVFAVVAGEIIGAPPAPDTSSYCGPRFHPAVYCTPGYVGPLYWQVYGKGSK